MTTEQLLEEALASPDPVLELRSVVLRLNAEGLTKDAILDRLEQMRKKLRDSRREKEEDAVMDVMDFLVGWCSPHVEVRLEKPLAPPARVDGASSLTHLSPSTDPVPGNGTK